MYDTTFNTILQDNLMKGWITLFFIMKISFISSFSKRGTKKQWKHKKTIKTTTNVSVGISP